MIFEGEKALLIVYLALFIFIVVLGGAALFLANKQLKASGKK
ncbi:hypothetical protein [Aquifex aeolicus]|nr:hypothetical protein [Aquifex aeolicus]